MIQTPWRTRSPASASRCRASDARWPVDAGERVAQAVDPLALARRSRPPCPGGRRGCPRRGPRRAPGASRSSSRRAWSVWASSASRMPRPNSALSSNSELAQAGPRPVGVDRPRRRRQVAAVDRRAAGRVGDDHPVAEQLADQLEVRRLAAAGAGAGELEQRLEHLRALDRVVRDQARGRAAAMRLEEVPARPARRRGARATGSMLMALWLDRRSCSSPGRRRRRRRSRCSRRARPGSSAGGRAGPATGTPCAGSRPARRRRRPVGKTFIRIVACGQTMAHLPQSMQIAGSQIGISGRSPASRTGSCRSGTCRRRQRADRQQVAVAGHQPRGDPRDEVRHVVRRPAAVVGCSLATSPSGTWRERARARGRSRRSCAATTASPRLRVGLLDEAP